MKDFIKDFVIVGLLILKLNEYEGWAVDGIARVFVSLAITVLFTVCLYELEKVVSDLIRR